MAPAPALVGVEEVPAEMRDDCIAVHPRLCPWDAPWSMAGHGKAEVS